MKILVVGDSYYGSEAFREGLSPLASSHEIEFADVKPDPTFEPRDDSERRLKEYEGNPAEVAAALTDHEVLVVHGAPVSLRVLQASPKLRLVCCARGGPVNVDVGAAQDLGIKVTTTPGKNAPAVADLTIAMAVMLSRGVQRASAYIRNGAHVASTFDGARFFGSELSSLALGLVGFGRVGTEVCSRALAFGMKVFACDPFVEDGVITRNGASSMSLEELVAAVDIVSLHARLTRENRNMIDRDILKRFKPGAFLINTAREGLVDEAFLVELIREGHIGGAAVDVFFDGGPLEQAVQRGEDRVVALPHIGGATHETIKRASRIIVQQVQAFETTAV